MAYHILIARDASSTELVYDRYFGSATTINLYWESIGRKLNLPIISSITERADTEDGFILTGNDLIAFKNEIEALEKYWIKNSTALPDDFLKGIKEILSEVNNAIINGLVLLIG